MNLTTKDETWEDYCRRVYGPDADPKKIQNQIWAEEKRERADPRRPFNYYDNEERHVNRGRK